MSEPCDSLCGFRQAADDLRRVHYLLTVRKLGDSVGDRLTAQRYLEVRRIAGRAEELLRKVADDAE